MTTVDSHLWEASRILRTGCDQVQQCRTLLNSIICTLQDAAMFAEGDQRDRIHKRIRKIELTLAELDSLVEIGLRLN